MVISLSFPIIPMLSILFQIYVYNLSRDLCETRRGRFIPRRLSRSFDDRDSDRILQRVASNVKRTAPCPRFIPFPDVKSALDRHKKSF